MSSSFGLPAQTETLKPWIGPNVFEVGKALQKAVAFPAWYSRLVVIPRNQARALLKESDYAFDHRIAW